MSKHWSEDAIDAMSEWVPPREWEIGEWAIHCGECSHSPGWDVTASSMTIERGTLEITADLINGDYNKTARAMLAALEAFNEDR